VERTGKSNKKEKGCIPKGGKAIKAGGVCVIKKFFATGGPSPRKNSIGTSVSGKGEWKGLPGGI